jgi:hypothetical protein
MKGGLDSRFPRVWNEHVKAWVTVQDATHSLPGVPVERWRDDGTLL